MHRLSSALLMAALTAAALTSVAAVALAAVPDEPTGLAAPADFEVSIHMTDRADGKAMRTFVSNTNRITAVVQFMDATNVNYQLRLRDLMGLEVYNQPVRLNGDGEVSRAIESGDFVDSYRGREAEERDALNENVAALQGLCSNPPGPPEPTPMPTPGAPTATPAPFTRWRSMMLDEIVSARTTAVELDRTLRATGSMPDVQDIPQAVSDLQKAHYEIATLITRLGNAERALSPPGTGPGTPTPNPPPTPDPALACTEVGMAIEAANEATTRSLAVMDAIPDDTSTWRFAPTVALYDDEQFKSCQPYVTQLYDAVQNTPATATSWTIGEPGAPALIFPSPDELSELDVGQLGLHLPDGAEAMYATTVTVPGANRMSEISAFVTDAQCIPVDGITMTFGVDPSDEGHTVLPTTAVIHGGVVTSTLTAGFTATQRAEVLGYVDVPGTPGGPSPSPKVGRKRFNVIGPAMFLPLRVNPKEINRLHNERAFIGVSATDAFNRHVADGTSVTVSIDGFPGVLATDIERQPGEKEPLLLGKTVEMVTVRGNATLPDGDDPGVVYHNNLYLMAGSDGDGPCTIEATSDDVSDAKTVFIRTLYVVNLPLMVKGYDLIATPQYSRTPAPPALGSGR